MRQSAPDDSAENALPPKIVSPLRLAFRVLLLVACAGGIVYLFQRNPEALTKLLNVGPWIMAALGGLFVVEYPLQSVRYHVVLTKVAGVRIAFGEWFRLFVLGQWLNVFFPQLGNVYRGVQLKKFHGVCYTGYISSYVAFAWVDTCINLAVTLAVLVAGGAGLTIAGMPAWGFVLTLLTAAILVPAAMSAFLRLPIARSRRLAWAHAKASQVAGGLRQSAVDVRYLARIASLGVVAFAITTVMFGACFMGMGVPVSLPALAMFCALYKLSNYVIITPGNLGVLELGCAVLGEQLHVGMAAGLLACGMVRVAGYSALFVELDRGVQDDIINRTAHAL